MDCVKRFFTSGFFMTSPSINTIQPCQKQFQFAKVLVFEGHPAVGSDPKEYPHPPPRKLSPPPMTMVINQFTANHPGVGTSPLVVRGRTLAPPLPPLLSGMGEAAAGMAPSNPRQSIPPADTSSPSCLPSPLSWG
jgi:hypothetical protein